MPKTTRRKGKEKRAAPTPKPKVPDDEPAAPQSAPPPVIVDDKKWTTGDFTIVSSDDVRFRVDSMALFVASPIFREASEMTSGEKIVHLTDPDFETAVVVRTFLKFVIEFDLQPKARPFSESLIPVDVPPPVIFLACFMHKYDCHLELRRLQYVFEKEHRYDATYSRDRFILAALAKSISGCAGAIEDAGAKFLGVASNTNSGGNSYKDTAPLIPKNMSKAIKNTIPNEYLAALVKGWEKSGKDRSRSEWARQFRIHLKESQTAARTALPTKSA
ncbi:uncharacterized protein LOC62_03G004118 [Vanrija pseudolonga]|uniref:BTB domain-containing protein n=1 Tax=Vanrija pseudolonga TaxID=143232 RepID=A0AAF1BHP8_9TREE|nr:hypothetical protein LOC62_03G004118 [Vanrija pseudolonga]